MNLLEQYIVEVHSEKPYSDEWVKKFPGKEFVEVEVTTDCYGRTKRDTHVFDVNDWKKYQEQGYWMG